LERIAARRGARVIEVDENVVQRRGPFAAGLHEHVAVEGARRDERHRGGEKQVHRALDGPHRQARRGVLFQVSIHNLPA
jgi:hypothetical protein